MEEDYRHEDEDEQLRYTEERLATTLPGGGSIPHHHSGPAGLHIRTSSQINSGKKERNSVKFLIRKVYGWLNGSNKALEKMLSYPPPPP